MHDNYNVHRIFSSFTMETILATAFGRVIDVQRGESSQLTKAAADIFAGSHEQNRTSGRFLSIVLSTCCQEYVT